MDGQRTDVVTMVFDEVAEVPVSAWSGLALPVGQTSVSQNNSFRFHNSPRAGLLAIPPEVIGDLLGLPADTQITHARVDHIRGVIELLVCGPDMPARETGEPVEPVCLMLHVIREGTTESTHASWHHAPDRRWLVAQRPLSGAPVPRQPGDDRPGTLSGADGTLSGTDEIPRRVHLDNLIPLIPAVNAIYDAMQAVEAMPADTRLSTAVILLEQAKAAVADYVNSIAPRA